jgi:hypothetical protein
MTEFLDKNNGNKNKPINKLMKGNSSNFDKRNSLLMNQNIPNNYNGNNINSFRRNLVVNTEININNKNEDKGFGNKSQNYLHFRLSTNYDEIKNLHSSKTLNSNILNNSKLLTNQSSGVKKAATNIAFKNESNIKKNYSFK